LNRDGSNNFALIGRSRGGHWLLRLWSCGRFSDGWWWRRTLSWRIRLRSGLSGCLPCTRRCILRRDDRKA